MNEDMTNAEASQYLVARLTAVEKKLDSIFYYSEGEDLLKTEKPNGWNVVEVFHHINLLNESYLDQFASQLKKAKPANNKKIKHTWIGKKLYQASLLGKNDVLSKSFKSPKAVDPKVQQAAGIAIVEKVVFQELLRDLKEIRMHAEALASKNLDQLKVKTLVPLLKVNMADALYIMIEHTNRHIAQASRILQS